MRTPDAETHQPTPSPAPSDDAPGAASDSPSGAAPDAPPGPSPDGAAPPPPPPAAAPEIETFPAAARVAAGIRDTLRLPAVIDEDADASPRRVAVIGCSAGGLPALEAFFEAMPRGSGTAVVVVQHASPDFQSVLPELLAKRASLTVRAARDGDRLADDLTLVVPPGHRVAFEGERLRLQPRAASPGATGSSGSIDDCLRSLASAFGSRSVALILSGTGEDGAAGARRVSEAGGMVIVQTPSSAEFPGMPEAAVATGRADHVLTPADAARVLAWLRGREGMAQRLLTDAAESRGDSVFTVIRELVEAEESFGLASFDGRMLARRIIQRMMVVDLPTPEDYAERLRWDAAERRRLLEIMIDGETGFFRDRESWRTLQELVIRRMVQEAGAEPLRIWVVGCSTGEDAYGVAMLVEEELGRADRRVPYKVFATDLFAGRVERASAGRFSASAVASVPSAMVHRHFEPDGQAMTVVPSLRRQLIFARHDVRSDPAFTRIDLVICRGVLSFLGEEGRRHALARMVQGLRPRGTLFIGGDERLDESMPNLRPLHPPSGLYTRHPDDRSMRAAFPGGATEVSLTAPQRERRQRERALTTALEAVLGEGRERMCLLLGTDGRLLHAFGDTRRFLSVKPGTLQTRVPELLVEPLRATVEGALARALRTGTMVDLRAIPMPLGDASSPATLVDVTVAPVAGDGSEQRQVTLVVEAVAGGDAGTGSDGVEPAAAGGPAGPAGAAASAASAASAAGLRSELARARASLRDVGDELAATLRQRGALADELRDTARRAHENHAELMAVNQELYTVNREHEAKIKELVQLNSDMENLLRTAQVGTVFLDRDLRIRRRTPAADILFRPDVASPTGIEHVHLPPGVPSLASDLQDVLRNGATIERQMRLEDGRDYLVYLHSYRRTDDGKLDGVVITIVDVTDLKQAELQLRRLNTELRNRNQEAEAFAHTVSHDLKSPLVTIGCMMGLLRESLAGHPDPEPGRYVDQTETTVQAMRQTIDDLLELSRVGRTRNRLSPVDLKELVGEVLESHAMVLDRNGVDVRVGGTLPTIEADRRRLFQVLDNLVGNALKYGCGPEGGPIIEIDAEWARPAGADDAGAGPGLATTASPGGPAAPDERGVVILSVSDHGPGVPEAFREQVFGLFQRLRRDQPGTGVGLALVRRIVEAHGGRVWVEDRPGGGARFKVAVPMTAPDETVPVDLGPVMEATGMTSPGADGEPAGGADPERPMP